MDDVVPANVTHPGKKTEKFFLRSPVVNRAIIPNRTYVVHLAVFYSYFGIDQGIARQSLRNRNPFLDSRLLAFGIPYTHEPVPNRHKTQYKNLSAFERAIHRYPADVP